MKKLLFSLSLAAFLGCTNTPGSADALREIGTMPSYEKGFEKGVSACYTAVYDNCLYIAGGCNFPETPAAEGGAKRYYRGIYKAIIGDTLHWEQCATLPFGSAYGACMQKENIWIIAGGMNENGPTATVLTVDLADNCHIDTLPSLPCNADNIAGALSGSLIFVVGGNIGGEASRRTFVLDINNPHKEWNELPLMPSRGRVQPVCAATNNRLYIWGGFTPADNQGEAHVHTDGVSYDILTGEWEKLPDIVTDGDTITLSGGIATTLSATTIITAGGVNRKIFTDAISGHYKLVSKDEYMHRPKAWYRFNPHLLQYDIISSTWNCLYSDSALARAGASINTYNDNILYIGGELKPGIRTPQIHLFTPR